VAVYSFRCLGCTSVKQVEQSIHLKLVSPKCDVCRNDLVRVFDAPNIDKSSLRS
jgi:predicted nucleic acid-binding Zn ribbon protein